VGTIILTPQVHFKATSPGAYDQVAHPLFDASFVAGTLLRQERSCDSDRINFLSASGILRSTTPLTISSAICFVLAKVAVSLSHFT
jgi:hypothetical protein